MFRRILILPLFILAAMTISSAQIPATRTASERDSASLSGIDAVGPAQKASVSPLPLQLPPSVSEGIPTVPSSNRDISPAEPNNKKRSWLKTLGSKSVVRQVLRSAATEYTLVRMGMGSGLMNVPSPFWANTSAMALPPGPPGTQGSVQNMYPTITTNVPSGYAPQGPGTLPPTSGSVVGPPLSAGTTLAPLQASQPGITPAVPTQAMPAPSSTVPVVRIDGAQVQRFALPDGRILVLFPDGAVGIQGTLNSAVQYSVAHPEPASAAVPQK